MRRLSTSAIPLPLLVQKQIIDYVNLKGGDVIIAKIISRRRLTMLLCALLLFGTFLSTTAYADSVTVSTAYSDSYFQTFSSKGTWVGIGTPKHYITETGQVVYCVQMEKTEPSNAPYSSVSGESVFSSESVRRGIELIIRNGYPTTNGGFSDDEARYATANAIRFFLVDCGAPYVPQWMNLNAYSQFFRARSGYEALWNWCLSLRAIANSQTGIPTTTHTVSFSNSSLALTEDGDYFVGQSIVTLSGCEGGYRLDSSSLPGGSSVYGYTGNSGDVLTVDIPVAYEQSAYTLYATGVGYADNGSLEFYSPSNNSGLQTVVTYVGADFSNLSDVAYASMGVSTPRAAPRTATVTVYKRDSETGALLAGAGFRLYSGGSLVAEGYTDSNGVLTFTGLPLGAYTFQEFAAPSGYVLDTSIHSFQLDTGGQNLGYDAYNAPIRVSLTIQKQDAETHAVLANAGYRLFDARGNQVSEGYTGSDGSLIFTDLPIGTYSYLEFSQPPGYLPDNSLHTVTLDGSSTSVQEIHCDAPCKGTITVTKQAADTLTPLENAGYRLYDGAGNQVREGYTDGNGTLAFTDLPLGSYTLREFSAPEGFLCSEEVYSFSFADEHLQESVTLQNERRTASVTVRKGNAAGEALDGVTFLLESASDDGSGWITVSRQITDRNGYVIWDGLSTTPGTRYRLTETSTVSGLSLQAESIFEGSLPEGGVYDVSFTVCDCAILTLPFTGGSGFGFLPVSMLVLCMGFFLISPTKRRRKERI